MSDAMLSRGSQRSAEIDVRESAHVRYWCRALGITRHQLFCAVSTVGDNVEHIRRFLRRAVPAYR
jgi:hypothetical protein